MTLLTQLHFTTFNTGQENYSLLRLWPLKSTGMIPLLMLMADTRLSSTWLHQHGNRLLVVNIFIYFKCHPQEHPECFVITHLACAFNSVEIPGSVCGRLRFQNDFLPADLDLIVILPSHWHRFAKLQVTAGKLHTAAAANEFRFYGDASHRCKIHPRWWEHHDKLGIFCLWLWASLGCRLIL